MPEPLSYSVYGLQVRSEMALPELFAAPATETPDISIRRGTIADSARSEPGLHARSDGLVLVIDAIAAFRISDGREILVDAEPGVPEENVRLYLLGSALGLLIHQRGLLPLHANAVEIGGKAVAFMGRSGQGKSTLAAWFHDHGYRIIADDVCVIRFDKNGRPLVRPGLPRLRLWREMLEASGREPTRFSRSYAGDATWEKYDVPILHENTVGEETQLAAIYLLAKADAFEIARLDGLDAAEAVFANTYRGGHVPDAGNVRSHFEACVALVRRTPIFVASRSWTLTDLAGEAHKIIAHAEALMVASETRNGDQR